MKQKHHIFASLLAAIALMASLAGCTEDFFDSDRVVEGEPVTVNLSLSATPVPNVIITRASGSDLSVLHNLVIFVFDGSGNYQQTVSTTDGTLTLGTGTGTSDVVYPVEFKTTSGTKKLLAVGNYNSAWWDQASITATAETFAAMKAKLMSLQYSKNEEGGIAAPIQMTSSDQMLMSGANEDIVFDINGNVTDWGESESDIAVHLQRAMAHVNFTIKSDADNGVSFSPTSYQVYNVPVGSPLVNSEKTVTPTTVETAHIAETNITGGKFDFYMPENIFAVQSGVTGYQDRDKWSRPTGSSGAVSPEDKEWTNAPQKSTFVVISGTYSGPTSVGADGNPTGGSTNVIGNVQYTVHLGDFSTSGSLGNFSVERNVSYTYNVTVKGVDNIVVEATTDKENQAGAEGTIYDATTTQYTYNLDAHYEQIFLEYNLSVAARSLQSGLTGEALDNAIADNLLLVVQSEAMDYTRNDGLATVGNKRGTVRPYKIYSDAVRGKSGNIATTAAAEAKDGVMKGAGSNMQPTKGFDYKWIQFWPQTSNTQLAAYPGVPDWAREDLTDMKNSDYYGGNATSNAQYLMDVYDVIVAMGNVVKKIYNGGTPSTTNYAEDGISVTTNDDGQYVARFTAFVDEYYYIRHPLTGEKIDVWSVFVNKMPREMLVAMSTSTSEDGNSSYSRIYSYVSQLSMQTFYNDRAEDIDGFGIETYNETPLSVDFVFGTPRSASGLTDSDGRTNQKILIGASSSTPQWSTYINTSSNGWHKSVGTSHASHKLDGTHGMDAYNVKKAYAACMSRNRDLNGNGKIDDNEVRWYLASVNEYIRIGIGARAISQAAQLYIGDKSQMTASDYPHEYIADGSLFFTSSSEDARKRVYWAVEKGSYSKNFYDAHGDWHANWDQKALPIRCIRLLPSNDEDQDISSVSGVTSDATYTYTAATSASPAIMSFGDRLMPALYRQRVEGNLAMHNEEDPANSFYSGGIYVASQPIETKYCINEINGYNQSSISNPCASYSEKDVTGWRVPNLVELSAMNAAGILTDDDYVTACTQFSNPSVRIAFSHSTLIYCPKTEDADWEGFQVRCVRDR